MVSDFGRGVADVQRGARFVLARPRLWVWLAAPAAVALVVLAGVVWLAVAWASPAIDAAAAVLPDAVERVAAGALTVVLIALLAVAGYFAFFAIAALLSAPFNEMLSEAIEVEITGAPPPPSSLGRLVRDVAVGIGHALRRVIKYAATVALLVAVGAVVPVVGAIASAIGGAWVTAQFAAYDAYDAVWARKGWRYADKLAYVRRHRGRALGLGAAIAALMAVPGFNLLALSFGAAGATLAFVSTGDDNAAAVAASSARATG